MKVTQITVNAGRTFNNPYESYSNLRPEVTLTASLDDGEDATTAAKALQAQAEGLVEEHKTKLLMDLDRLHTYQTRTRDIARLELQAEQERTGGLQLSVLPADRDDYFPVNPDRFTSRTEP
jgi:predicted signal transduction protein with EAL and GGDEF domain